jgi:hypothetical protein
MWHGRPARGSLLLFVACSGTWVMLVTMSDNLQVVVGFLRRPQCPVSDKLKFVGHDRCLFIRLGVLWHMGDSSESD